MQHADVIIANEPTPGLRTLAVRLLTAGGGAGLPLATVFVAGNVKLSKAGAAFVNTTNLPTPIADGQAGSFNFTLEQLEVDAPGAYRVQFTPPGGDFEEIVFFVRASGAIDVNAVVAGISAMVMDPDAPANAKTFQEQWNLLCSESFGDGDGLDGPLFVLRGLIGAVKTRLAGTYISGKRRFTQRDGRP